MKTVHQVGFFSPSVELGRQEGWFGPKRGVYLGGRLEVSQSLLKDDAEDRDVVCRGASWFGVMEVRRTSQFGWKAPTLPLSLGLALQFLPPPYFR